MLWMRMKTFFLKPAITSSSELLLGMSALRSEFSRRLSVEALGPLRLLIACVMAVCLASFSTWVSLRIYPDQDALLHEKALAAIADRDANRMALVRNSTTVSGAELLSQSFSKRIIVSENARIIYCPIPKIASSNWKYLIRKFEGVDDFYDLSKAHLPETSGMRYLSDYSAAEVERLILDKTYFKFVFVRDPYARALSCYMDKFLNMEENYIRSEYRTFLAQLYDWRYARSVDLDAGPRPSFLEFVDEIAKQNPIQMNEHWMPQYLLCGFGEMPYDFVGRLENLRDDAKFVLDRIGRKSERFPSQDEIGFPSSGASALKSNDMFTIQLMMKLRIIYDIDFNSIGR